MTLHCACQNGPARFRLMIERENSQGHLRRERDNQVVGVVGTSCESRNGRRTVRLTTALRWVGEVTIGETLNRNSWRSRLDTRRKLCNKSQ
jgi:hypothetical protein